MGGEIKKKKKQNEKAFLEIVLMLQSLCSWVPDSEGVNDQ